MNNVNSSARMLLVSRHSSAVSSLRSVSKVNSWQLDVASSGLEALERLEVGGARPDLVLLDMTPGDSDGLHTLRWLRRTRPELSVIILSDGSESDQMKEASQLGIQDCVAEPFQELELERTIKFHLNGCHSHSQAEPVDKVDQLIADFSLISDDPAVQKLRIRAEQLANLDVPVLFLGDSGNSKELVARLIHRMSARSAGLFLGLNCSAFTSELLEFELFGFDQPGSSSQSKRRQGKFEMCHGGTILLDELAEMPLSLQGRVLQLLDNHQFLRPGSELPVEVDVRVLAAVNVDVEKAIAENKLSQDLYYRLSAYPLYVPPLKELKKQTNHEHTHGLKSLVRNAKGEAEKKAIAIALEETHWNRKAAARLLCISYRALLYKIQEYQISPPNAYLSPNLLLQNGAKEN